MLLKLVKCHTFPTVQYPGGGEGVNNKHFFYINNLKQASILGKKYQVPRKPMGKFHLSLFANRS